MNGILLKDNPTPIVVLNSNLDLRYTTDGTEPGLANMKPTSVSKDSLLSTATYF